MLNYRSDTFAQLSLLYENFETTGRCATSLESINRDGWNRSDFFYLERLGYVIRTETDITITVSGQECYLYTYNDYVNSVLYHRFQLLNH